MTVVNPFRGKTLLGISKILYNWTSALQRPLRLWLDTSEKIYSQGRITKNTTKKRQTPLCAEEPADRGYKFPFLWMVCSFKGVSSKQYAI